MAKVYEMGGMIPVIDPTSFVHPDAVFIGDVIIGPNCYIGACACLRGDLGRIVIGAGANIQDTCVIHSFPEVDVIVGENGHVGHGAILHGCTIGRNALIGMNAVVMDHAVIGENSFVAAMAFVKSGMTTGANMLIGGMPAREIRPLEKEEINRKAQGTLLYQWLAAQSLVSMKEAKPLTEAEPNRGRISPPPSIPPIP
ncbi:acyltransferase [Geotalea toluenoxydans]|uniref:acyltransferase n=1 Tax=Geotalea toluenoxydans TaxID=421624 RepID=UPI0006D1486D|nr:transferase hexapeptide repeat family protein [Geotalea toluenoxydans]